MELADALSFAAEQKRGVLATLKRDGRPQLSNISFSVEDELIRISITADRAKTANARRDPRVSLHVTSESFWPYAVIEGDAELSEVAQAPDDATVEELVAQYRWIRGEDHPDWDEFRQAMVDDRRLVLRLRPTHAYGTVGSG